MGILNRLRDAISDDSVYYALAAAEIDSGRRRQGMWAKALTEAKFNEQAAQAIYMRALVKALQKEQRDAEDVQADTERRAMNHAFAHFDARRYVDSLQGLVLLHEKRGDLEAAACLGYIAWHGIVPGHKDQQVGLEFLTNAERSTNPRVRHRVGAVFETINLSRALTNYEFAADNGDREAKQKASRLRKTLKARGLLPKNLLDRLLG